MEKITNRLPNDEFVPREYQVELFETAMEKNTIVCLGTGCGKTFIAVMLIRELSSAVRIPWSSGGKRTFFLVNTRLLVAQQASVLNKCLDLSVGSYVGSQELDAWKKRDWESQFERHQVIVLSSQILLDIMNHGFLDISRINLLVFDECHHTISDSPMRMIMQNICRYPSNLRPRLLGLSASIITRKISLNDLEKFTHSLEVNLNCSIATSSDLLSIKRYCTCPHEFVVIYTGDSCTTLYNTIHYYVINYLYFLKQHSFQLISTTKFGSLDYTSQLSNPIDAARRILNDLLHVMETLGVIALIHALDVFQEDMNRLLNKVIYDRHARVLSVIPSILNYIKVIIYNEFGTLPYALCLKHYGSSKLLKLIEILMACSSIESEIIDRADNLSSNDSITVIRNVCKPNFIFKCESKYTFSGVIFVKRRIISCVLGLLLKEVASNLSELSYLQPHYIMGSCQQEYKQPDLSTRNNQDEVLHGFRSKKYNLLVSTSVLEEGIDVPQCNLIVRFEFPEEFRAYIQSKGRARSRISFYIMLLSEKNYELRNKQDISSYHAIEKHLVKFTPNLQNDILENELMKAYAEKNVFPFVPGLETNAHVTRTSSISLINRYCSMLPNDVDTRLSPLWTIIDHYKDFSEVEIECLSISQKCIRFSCSLRLPINSCVKETVNGLRMPSKRLAKQSAAILMCELLYKRDEFDHYLLPVSRRNFLADVEKEEKVSCKNEITKSRSVHLKTINSILNGHSILTCTHFYMYAIDLRVTHPIPSQYNVRDRPIFYPEHQQMCLGIISSQKYPNLCGYHIYSRSGEILVNINAIDCNLKFNADQLDLLKFFHEFIFHSVLDINNFHLKFSFEESLCSLFIVPLFRESLEINWDLLKSVYEDFENDTILNVNHSQFCFESSAYKDAVIIPTYKKTNPIEYYYVANVRSDMSPCSPFPGESYASYVDYYMQRYNLQVHNSQQYLLEVDRTPMRLNLLTPRYMSSHGNLNTAPQASDAYIRQIYLIPEFCTIHKLPAQLWRQVVLLPSIMFRLASLLMIERFRRNVAEQSGIGRIEMNDNDILSYDWSFAQAIVDSSSVPNSIEDVSYSKRYSIDRCEIVFEEVYSDEEPDLDIVIENSDFGNHIGFAKDCDDQLETSVISSDDISMLGSKTTSLNNLSITDSTKTTPLDNSLIFESDDPMLDQVSQLKFDQSPQDGNLDLLNGPSIAQLLRAFTLSKACDGFNLERLETLGDSFLKFSVTVHLYITYPNLNEGRLSFLRSYYVSNQNLFRLAGEKQLGTLIIGSKFEPKVNWIPPGFAIKTNQKSTDNCDVSNEDSCALFGQQVLSRKCLADCVEALIGVYLLSCGTNGAMLFLNWLGIGILPSVVDGTYDNIVSEKLRRYAANFGDGVQVICSRAKYGLWPLPRTAMVEDILNNRLIVPLLNFERILKYEFSNKLYLLQAMTHASYYRNVFTDCYQRLEFLGDAVLDYLITRVLYEDRRRHNPGQLTDLRSALVNNSTFALLAVQNDFHKYFLHYSVSLLTKITHFTTMIDDIIYTKKKQGLSNFVSCTDLQVDDDEAPKALGDIFESVAGAIYLDSGYSLDAVWSVYYRMMKRQIHKLCENIPKSPIRCLLEKMPEKVRFRRPVKCADGRIRVTVDIFGNQVFSATASNYRTAKHNAAKRALHALSQATSNLPQNSPL